ncbi:hypothetical protein BDQ12DRAFT_667725 [Crucibulum laeve]|uniref:Uncharacterized protein n=1 Tax=Crucibulum laeve TaxID=68775 RepID=A0A5C3LU00_9AGAR|nr:hypothetical protein BDQ12DRAFT_667725 [Crucibulum laeve]
MPTDDDRPFPPSLTLYVGCYNSREEDGGRQICFWKDGRLLVIQAPSGIPPEYENWGKDPTLDEFIKNDYQAMFEKVVALASSFRFDRGNWAYFVPRGNTGVYSLSYRRKPLKKITCPTWTIRVPERDVLVTKWITVEERHVDLLLGHNDFTLDLVQAEMTGQRYVWGLDLTFEVLGHIVNDEDEVIGIMTEPAYGRLVEYRDRTAVYTAMVKLERMDLYYSTGPSNIMVSNGKIRFLSLSSVRKFDPQDEKQAAKAKLYNWDTLETMFKDLSTHENFYTPSRYWKQNATVVTIIPPPNRPFIDATTAKFIRIFIYYRGDAPRDLDDRRGALTTSRRSHKKCRATGSARGMDLATELLVTRYDTSRQTIMGVPPSSHTRRSGTIDPYSLFSATLHPSRKLISSRTSDQTSESECSLLE